MVGEDSYLLIPVTGRFGAALINLSNVFCVFTRGVIDRRSGNLCGWIHCYHSRIRVSLSTSLDLCSPLKPQTRAVICASVMCFSA